jgi:hypothetical protein
VCTVATQWSPGQPLRILAIRDELVSRDFDGPDEWWPAQPGVVGGRDRQAGGSWCVSDIASGVSALVLNRAERRTGTPSRGVLPLAAVAAGPEWPERVDHRDMAAFNLVLAGPAGVMVWTWNTTTLDRIEPTEGAHLITSGGVDSGDAKTVRFAPALRTRPWLDVVTSCSPEDDPSALVVRHQIDADTYATVFGQLITATPGRLAISSSRRPWQREGWTDRLFPAPGAASAR